jgi:hypothetical protein
MPHLQKSAVIRDFFQPPWFNSLHTQLADSFGNLACGTNESGLFLHAANNSKPPAPDAQYQFLQI